MATMRQVRANTNTRAILWCSICGAQRSATPGDYWHLADNYRFRCHGLAMELVTKETRMVPVLLGESAYEALASKLADRVIEKLESRDA